MIFVAIFVLLHIQIPISFDKGLAEDCGGHRNECPFGGFWRKFQTWNSSG
jgi:hypothetical protein